MATKQDPYAHRKHREKYQLGYGAEGAARGKNELPGGSELSPKEQSYAQADAEHLKGVLKKGETPDGQMSKKNPPVYTKSQKSKTRPNPY